MNIRNGRTPFLALLAALLVATLALASCNLADPATWQLITPEAPVTASAACDAHRTLAALRAALPYDQSALYFTGRTQDGGDISTGLTFWYVDPEIPLEGDDAGVEAVIAGAVDRLVPVLDAMLTEEPCLTEVYDVILFGIVDAGYNSWYLGNVATADLAEGASADRLLSSPEMLLPETWPQAAGEAPAGSCTWAEATANMEACTSENGGCLYALVEQMGPLAVAQTQLPMPLEAWAADRDQDMQMAETVVAPLQCLHPPAYSKVMNFVAEDGTLLFAGEWSGAASQVSYWIPGRQE